MRIPIPFEMLLALRPVRAACVITQKTPLVCNVLNFMNFCWPDLPMFSISIVAESHLDQDDHISGF